MWDLLPASMRNFIDSIFAPPLSFLNLMVDFLGRVGTVAGKGINLNNYFSFFGYLPPAWQLAVKSALASVVLLAMLFLVRMIWNAYLKTKNSAQWW